MDRKDLKRVCMAAMFLVLVITAPNWLGKQGQHTSSYEAPWIYPALEPVQH